MKKKKHRIVRKSASWLEYDRQIEESEARDMAELAARVAPYPAYEFFQFPRQRGLSYLDTSLLRYVHEQQHGEDGCTASDLEIVAVCAAPENVTQALKALKRFRKRGLILPTDNGNGIYVRLPLILIHLFQLVYAI